LVVFDLGDLATKVAEIPGCEMPDDFKRGRDSHPIHLLILIRLTRPAFEPIVPMLFHIAVPRQESQLALLIHIQHPEVVTPDSRMVAFTEWASMACHSMASDIQAVGKQAISARQRSNEA
jgi:hypothetical protein